MTRKIWYYSTIVLLITVAACAARQKTLAMALEKDVRHYFRAVMQKKWMNASRFLPVDQRAETLADWAASEEDTTLGDFTIDAIVPIDDDASQAIVTTEQINENSMTVKRIKRFQIWEHSHTEGWYIRGDYTSEQMTDFQAEVKAIHEERQAAREAALRETQGRDNEEESSEGNTHNVN
jgi:hypothetical protein